MGIEEITLEEEDYFRNVLFRIEMMEQQHQLIEKIIKNFLCHVSDLIAFRRKLEMNLSYLSKLRWPKGEAPDVLFDDVLSKFQNALKFVESVAYKT